MAAKPTTVGYSGTPLWKKLGLKPSMIAISLNTPDDYPVWLGDDDYTDAPLPATVIKGGENFIHLFTTERAELAEIAKAAFDRMARDGMLWVSWPKKSSKVPTELTEDVIRDVCLPLGLVDVKVCAVSDVWSGLKLMVRKELR
ncbi:MAG: DUF3052 domain-containing protein [Pseudomonadota bacterium]